MRIGLFTDTYPPHINGVSTSVFVLKKALEKLGHQVYVVTVNNQATKYQMEENGRVIRVPAIKTGIYDYRLGSVYPIKVVNTIRKWKLDVIHSHTEFSMGIFARFLAKQYNIPLVHTYHTMYEDYVHYITKGYFDKSSKKIVEYLTMFYCDKTAQELIVPTKKTYDLFKQKYRFDKNINIIPTGLEVERFYQENVKEAKVQELKKTYELMKGDFVLIFVGRLAQEKNVEFLLDVMKDITKTKKNIKLLIVGSGPDKEKYESIVKRAKLEKNVIFTGKVPYDEIPAYYQLSDVFLTASTTETQGLTVVEAMAGGIVPLCIDDEAFHLVVVDELNGLFFKTKKECRLQILKLYEDLALRKKYANQARISAERFSSKYYAEGALEVYRRAINEGRGNRYGWFQGLVNRMKRR